MNKLLIIFFFLPNLTFGMEVDSLILQNILDEIYESVADYRVSKPEIEITNTQSYVAKYSPGSHKISVESKAIEVCKLLKPFEKEALAFIIGHELAHSYQDYLSSNDESSFLAYHKINTSSRNHSNDAKEKEADVFGAFSAYLAGYEIQNIFPDIIDSLYSSYNIGEKLLSNYPSKSYRKKTATSLSTKLDTMVNLYESATLFSLSGYYDEAKNITLELNKNYKGCEIYNLIASNILLEVIDLKCSSDEGPFYPIELDFNSSIQRAQTVAAKSLSELEKQYISKLLQDAMIKLDVGAKMNPYYFPIRINKVYAFLLNENHKAAWNEILTIEGDINLYSEDEQSLIILSKGIIYNELGHENGDRLLKELINHNDEQISKIARFNLVGNCDEKGKIDCFHQEDLFEKSRLDFTFSFSKTGGSNFNYYSDNFQLKLSEVPPQNSLPIADFINERYEVFKMNCDEVIIYDSVKKKYFQILQFLD